MTYVPAESRYATMTYNRSGRSGLLLPAISLGMWHNFGENNTPEIGRQVCCAAFDLGITHFDLANNYGPPPGAAESFFGRLLATEFRAYRDELIISTKAGYLMWPGPYGEWGSRKYLLASLDQSLQRMGLDYIDIFYSHRPDPDTPLEETMEALASAVRQGKALYVGISSYGSADTARAQKILRGLGIRAIIHQPSYSILNRWTEEDRLLDTLEQEGMGCIVFSPLAQGLLTDRYLKGVPADSRAGQHRDSWREGFLSEANLARIRKLNDIARKRGQSLAQMAIAWVLRDRRMTSALIGASRPEQVRDCVGALANPGFSPEELAAIDAAGEDAAVNLWKPRRAG
ncbi:MAG TPA: L-glyceraldehyde 3-phosphate reductase [Kiloniellales bacterium]